MFKMNDYVKHEKFGVGRILDIYGSKKEARARIFFVQIGEKVLMPNVQALSSLSDEELEEFTHKSDYILLERIDKEHDNKEYKNIEHAIEGFQKELNTQDFDGEFYRKDERDYKVHFHEFGLTLFGKEVLHKLLEEKNYDELKSNYKKFFACSYEGTTQNLTHYLEPLKLYDTLDTQEKTLAFFDCLYNLLYGKEEFELRFSNWINMLDNLDNAKWTMATIFLFIIHPDKFMYVKPETTKNALVVSGFYANYTSRPSYAYYRRVLECSEYIFDKTKSLGFNPKDMIDVQSFMWCIRPSYDNEGRAYENN